jgi:hypothetical protein
VSKLKSGEDFGSRCAVKETPFCAAGLLSAKIDLVIFGAMLAHEKQRAAMKFELKRRVQRTLEAVVLLISAQALPR